MRMFVIERQIPGIGSTSSQDMQGIAQKSNGVLCELGRGIQWQHSYVTQDKVYCVYLAESREQIEEHARRGGFPANAISEVVRQIDPTTATPRHS